MNGSKLQSKANLKEPTQKFQENAFIPELRREVGFCVSSLRSILDFERMQSLGAWLAYYRCLNKFYTWSFYRHDFCLFGRG